MQRRQSRSSSRKTPHIGSVASSNNNTNRNPDKRTEPAVFEDTAANDHYLTEFSDDLFQQPPRFLQRFFLSFGAIIRRLIFLSVMAAVLSYFYPDSLSALMSGAKKISVMLDSGMGGFFRDAPNDHSKVESANSPALHDSRVGPANNNASEAELNNILSQIASEITSADVKQQRKNQQQSGSNSELNKAMREKFERRPLGRVPVTIAPHKVVAASPRAQLRTQQRTRPRMQSIVSNIPERELNQIIRRYSKNYILGDITAIGNLFIDSGNVQQQQAIEKLLKNYVAVFENSSQRWVEFQNLVWVHAANRATATGTIRSESTLQKGRRSIAANVVIELRRNAGVTKIARLDFSDEKASLALSKSTRIINPALAILPNRSELRAMVTRFVSAYKRADIVSMDAMFSKDIISNSSSGKAAVRKDYEDLFSASRKREITIRDLRWKFSKKRAKGVGEMKVVVVSIDNNVRTIKGKIQFVAKKIANTVLITHLYHIEHSR